MKLSKISRKSYNNQRRNQPLNSPPEFVNNSNNILTDKLMWTIKGKLLFYQMNEGSRRGKNCTGVIVCQIIFNLICFSFRHVCLGFSRLLFLLLIKIYLNGTMRKYFTSNISFGKEIVFLWNIIVKSRLECQNIQSLLSESILGFNNPMLFRRNTAESIEFSMNIYRGECLEVFIIRHYRLSFIPDKRLLSSLSNVLCSITV